MDYWIIIASIVAILPVYLIKEYLATDNFNYLFLAMLGYLILLISYVNIFKKGDVGTSYVMLQLVQILLVVGYGNCG
jgi:hypothetical protein